MSVYDKGRNGMQMLGAPEPGARSDERRSSRCPQCGGLNPADADWCGQCLARFVPPEVDGPELADDGLAAANEQDFASWGDLLRDAGEHDPTAPPAPSPGDGQEFDPLTDPFPGERAEPSTDADRAAPVPSEPSREPLVEHRSGAFAVSGRRISWTCSRCENDNPLDNNVCSLCGTSFSEVVGPPEEPRIKRDPNMAALVSLFFPGAGHGYLGMWGQAVARGALSAWVLAVAVFAIVGNGLPGSLFIGIVFGLAAIGLWVVAAHDVFREASHQPAMVLLRPRAFLYVTIVLLFVLFSSLMMAAFSVTRAAG